MSAPLIDVRGLQMAYGDKRVLAGVDFSVGRGEVVGLLGPNGAGKTTTMDILGGFRRPSAGEVDVLGEAPISASESWRARVGIVQQSWRDHAKWRVHEFLDYLGSYYRPYATGDVARPWPTDDLLEVVGLSGSRDTQLRRLSGGQRRRLDVADGSPDQLRGRVGSTTEIIWTDDTGRHVHATEDPTGFLRAHLAAPEARMDALEVRRSTLEDVYLSLIRRVEHGEDLALPELSASPSGAGTHPTEDR